MQKNILVTTSGLPIESKSGFVFKLSRELGKKHDVSILAPLEKNTCPEEEVDGITIYRYKYLPLKYAGLSGDEGIMGKLRANRLNMLKVPFFLLAQLWAIRKLAKQRDIHVIHAHWLIPQGFLAVVYKKFCNPSIKIVITCHGSDVNVLRNRFFRLLQKFTLRNADSITPVSHDLESKIQKIGVQNKEISVIPMGIDTQVFQPSDGNVKKALGIKGMLLLFVGWFNKEKGIPYILRAMPEILKKHPTTTLLLIGDGNLREELEQLVKDLHLTEHVVFNGYVGNSRLPEYYSSADVVLMPSLNEGSPVVLPEALACGAIVIASDLPVYQEHITDGQNGFIVKRADSDDLARKVMYILDHYNDIQDIKNTSRQYIIEHFDWKVIGERYCRLLNSMKK